MAEIDKEDRLIFTERQIQAIEYLSMALERMRQEGLSEYDIVFWFQKFMGTYLEKVYHLKLFIGSTSKGAETIPDVHPKVQQIKDAALTEETNDA